MNGSKIIKVLMHPLVAAIVAILIGLLIGAIVMLVAGYDPKAAYEALFDGIFGKPRYLVNIVIKATPIILTGLSVAFAFKTGLFNIGAEGQYMIGATTAAILGYVLILPAAIHIPIVIIGAMLTGAVWSGIAGLLKAKWDIHEVITTIMLNWIALYLQNFLIMQSWLKKPNSESSYEVRDSARVSILGEWKFSDAGKEWAQSNPEMGDILLRTDVNAGIILAVAAAILIGFILKRSTLGYSLKAVGFNRFAAEASGIDIKKNTILSMCIAGAVAGLSGCLNTVGSNPFRIGVLSVSEGYGFDGISVALIAHSSPIGCILSALLLSGLRYGGQSLQSELGVPSEVISIIIGVIVFIIAISTIFNMLNTAMEKRRSRKL